MRFDEIARLVPLFSHFLFILIAVGKRVKGIPCFYSRNREIEEIISCHFDFSARMKNSPLKITKNVSFISSFQIQYKICYFPIEKIIDDFYAKFI